jgi:hypothetical protein
MRRGNTYMKSLLVVLVLIAAMGPGVLGQKYSDSTRDQTLRGSGRVNSSTLAMEFQLPLGEYPGRGVNVPISLSYSSKVWRAKYIASQPRVNNPDDCISNNIPLFAENSASGWTTSLGTPYIEYVGWSNLYNASTGDPAPAADCPEGGPSYYYAVIKRILVHLPSGETHELRVDDTPNSYPTYSSPPAKDGTYLAVDGSNIRYVEDATNGVHKLMMPDGSFYTLKNSTESYNMATVRKAERYTDRNGNYTTYNSSNNTWTDTLGRTLAAPLGLTAPTSPTVQTYTMPGFGGGDPITYKFYWRKLKDDTEEESALTDFNLDLKYMADRATMSPSQSPRTSGFLFASGWGAWLHDGSAPVFNPVVLSEIELPTGQKFKFTYDIYGKIERIYYPTGGEERFEYGVVAPLTPPDAENVSDQMNFGVVDRKVYESAGQGTPYEWTYAVDYVAPSGYRSTVVNPDGTRTERFLHRGVGSGSFGFEDVLIGMPYEDRHYDSDSRLLSKKLTHWTKKTFGEADWHPRVDHEESYVYEPGGDGVYGTTKYEYDGDLDQRDTPVLVKKVTEYAFTTTSGGNNLSPDEDPDPEPTPVPTPTPSASKVRITETTYLISDSNYSSVKSYYTAQNMVGLVTAQTIKDGAGTVVGRIETVYDDVSNYPLITPGSPSGQWTAPANSYRGNPNTAKVWDSTKGAVTNSSAYIATHAQFDTFGNQRVGWDALGNSSTTAFDTTYYAFPISLTSPVPDPSGVHGSSAAFVTSATFDPTTGLPLTTTDANGLETRIEYDSDTLRPLNTKTYYNNVQVGGTVETVYHDEEGNYWVKDRTQIDSDHWAETTT